MFVGRVSLHLKQRFLLEALLRHELLYALQVVIREVYLFCLLSVLVKHVEDWWMMWYEVEPEPNVRVSVASAQDELA